MRCARSPAGDRARAGDRTAPRRPDLDPPPRAEARCVRTRRSMHSGSRVAASGAFEPTSGVACCGREGGPLGARTSAVAV